MKKELEMVCQCNHLPAQIKKSVLGNIYSYLSVQKANRSDLVACHSGTQHPPMARHRISFEITTLQPPIRLAIHLTRIPEPVLKRSASMQHPPIIENDRIALAQLMSVHCSGCLHKRRKTCKRIVKLMRRVAREGCLERWAIAHRGDARRLYASASTVGWRGRVESDGRMGVVEMPRVVDVLERDGRPNEPCKVRGVGGT